jgi:hypothetical protein
MDMVMHRQRLTMLITAMHFIKRRRVYDSSHYADGRASKRARETKRVFRERQLMDDMWIREKYRLSKSSFDKLVQKLTAADEFKFLADKRSVGPHAAIGYLMNRFCAGTSLRAAAEFTGVAPSTAHKIDEAWVQFVKNKFSREMIVWPEAQQFDTIGAGFKDMTKTSNFEGIIGAVDGIHIIVRKPMDNSVWHDKDDDVSIACLAICDHKGHFTWLHVGSPGSYHDSRVWRRGEFAKNNERFIPNQDKYHLVGDSGFPLLSYLITVFDIPETVNDRRKQKFNTALSRARRMIECAFGRFRARFRINCRTDLFAHDYKKLVWVIVGLFCLHNWCSKNNDEWADEDMFNIQEEHWRCNDPTLDTEARGKEKRQWLVDNLVYL